MKKLILAIAFLLTLSGLTFAQTSPAGPKKKDGTADMRYKANKDAKKNTVVHTKKDGTADKRFKENKKPPTK